MGWVKSWSGRAIVFSRETSFNSSQTRIADRAVRSEGVKSASGGVSVWVSSDRFRVMAGPFVGAARGRCGAVGPGDKRDKPQLLVRDKRQLSVALVLMAMKTAAGVCGQQ